MQANYHYWTVLTDNLIWQGHFERDFSTLSPTTQVTCWWELYRQQVTARHHFYREFPEFQKVGAWVMPRFSEGWIDVYEQAHINPILLQPAINRIYRIIRWHLPTATLTFTTENPNVKCGLPISQRYLMNFGKLDPGYRDVIGFMITFSPRSLILREDIDGLRVYLSGRFNLAIPIDDDMTTLFFDGYLITQSNGADIWVPLKQFFDDTDVETNDKFISSRKAAKLFVEDRQTIIKSPRLAIRSILFVLSFLSFLSFLFVLSIRSMRSVWSVPFWS
jgi:hypothetical protein